MRISALSIARLKMFTGSPQPAIQMQGNSARRSQDANQDSLAIANKKYKKRKKIAGFITAALALSACALYACKKIMPPKEAKAAAKRANEFARNVLVKINNTAELYANGGKNAQGKIVAEITESAENPAIKFMEEIPEDSITLVKRSQFNNGVLEKIEEFISDSTRNVTTLKNGKPIMHEEGIRTYKGKNTLIAKEGYFEDDKIYLYSEGLNLSETNNDYSQNIRLYLSEKGKVIEYLEGIKKTEKEGCKIARHFVDGKLKTNINMEQ